MTTGLAWIELTIRIHLEITLFAGYVAPMKRRLINLILWMLPLLATAEVHVTPGRIVAFGDVHGAHTELLGLLQAAEILNNDGLWVAGGTHLVSVGDLLDRGPDSKKTMDLLMRLQNEAPAAGGRVHVLLGNHEAMNMAQDLRDVSEGEFAALGGAAGHRAAFSESGVYGQWLRALPVAVKINETLFSHGGFSDISLKSLDELNEEFHSALDAVVHAGRAAEAAGLVAAGQSYLTLPTLDGDVPEPFKAWHHASLAPALGAKGLIWYRGNTACHPLLEATNIASVLRFHGAQRVVVGHTPTRSREIESHLSGRVIAIDTGMLAKVYRGNPRALEISAEGAISVITPEGRRRLLTDVEHETRTAGPDSERYEVIKMRSRAAAKARAAFLLSEYLGLQMVAPVELTPEGVERLNEPLITERRRQQQGLHRPNYCSVGSDFELLQAFDALIGKLDRNLDNLAYHRKDWSIRALQNETALGTSSELPNYAQVPRLVAALRRPLSALNPDVLNDLLGELLRPREIRSLLKRRDKILLWASE